jgi:hypothetical protein
MPAPKDPIKYAEWLQKIKERTQTEKFKQNIREKTIKRFSDPKEKEKTSIATKLAMNTPKVRKNISNYYNSDISKEDKKRRSERMKGESNPMKNPEFLKKAIKNRPDVKGKNNPNYGHIYTKEEILKLSKAHIGLMVGEKNPMFGKRGKDAPMFGKTQEKHPNWKGEFVSYSVLHIWVRKYKGTPTICTKCGKTELKGKQIHWANVDHKYRRVLDDYIRLCTKCHYEYDIENGLRKSRKIIK